MDFKVGIDEAGRGPWAGPVYAGIVIVTPEQEIVLKELGVTDSKKLTEKKRTELYSLILNNVTYAKVKRLSAEDIDKIGIYKSTIELIKSLSLELDSKSFAHELSISIDGVFPGLELFDKNGIRIQHECIIKGDCSEPSISAASILAKVKRDFYMMKLHEKYPQYSFDKHKGYGTKLHHELIHKHGICEEHRKSFRPIKVFLPEN